MNKKLVIRGLIFGIGVPLLVALLFIAGFALKMNIGFHDGFKLLRFKGQLPNVMRIGLLANLVMFTFLVRSKELVARGIAMATIVLLIVSLII